MARGDQRHPVFQDELRRKRFLESPVESCGKPGWLEETQ
jgi:hypothetical protein